MMIVGVVVNVIFDYFLIFGEFGFLRLEFVGVGFVLVFSVMMIFLFLIGYVFWYLCLWWYFIFGWIWCLDWFVFG